MTALGRRLAAVTVATVLALLVPAGSAQAHDGVLASSTPAAGQALDSPPAEVRLHITRGLAPIDPLVVVRAADGTSVADGPPQAADGVVVQALVPDVADGRYTVSWRVVVDDGHPASGTFTFTVGSVASAGPTGSAAVPVADPSSSSSGRPGAAWLAVAAAVLVALFFLPALVWRRRRSAVPTTGTASPRPDPGESR